MHSVFFFFNSVFVFKLLLANSIAFFFFFFSAAPAACGSSQVRGQIGAASAGLHHSHSNVRSELHL